MVFGLFASKDTPGHRDIGPQELQALLHAGEAIVVDVREVDEFATGHIPGAINLPLSTFQPSQLPVADGKALVLHCMGGKRSAMALEKCGMAQAAVNTQLAGGIVAWQAAGLPIEQGQLTAEPDREAD